LLFGPSLLRHAEILQVARERAVERPARVALAAESPVRVRGAGDVAEEGFPGFHPDDAVRPPRTFARGCHQLNLKSACSMERPRTSMRLRSVVPTPWPSASRRMLSHFWKGPVP